MLGMSLPYRTLLETDDALDPEIYVPKSREFAKFMLSRSRRNIWLAHLNVNHRPEFDLSDHT